MGSCSRNGAGFYKVPRFYERKLKRFEALDLELGSRRGLFMFKGLDKLMRKFFNSKFGIAAAVFASASFHAWGAQGMRLQPKRWAFSAAAVVKMAHGPMLPPDPWAFTRTAAVTV